jgi:hypothetical protein
MEQITPLHKEPSREIISAPDKKQFCFKIQRKTVIDCMTKALSISIHIFIMSIFEIYFYFNYVMKLEKEKFTEEILRYSSKILSQLESRPISYKKIYGILHSTISEKELREKYINAIQQQKQKMDELLYESCKMSGTIGIFVLFFIAINICYQRTIQWKTIFVENIIMFASLGVFEYMFFMNVVLVYNPITDAEVEYLVYMQFSNVSSISF